MNVLLNSDISAIVDIVALVLVACFALWGLMRGFVKTFFSTFGTILSLLIAILLAPTVVSFLQSKFALVDTISQAVSGFLTDRFGEALMNAPLSTASRELLAEAGVYGFIIDIIINLQAESDVSSTATLNQVICPTFAYYIALIVCIIALFIILKLIFKLICEIVKNMHKIKGFARFDKLFGFILGLVHGIIVLELVILSIKIIPIGFLQDIYAGVQASKFALFVENIGLYNILIGFMTRINVVGFIKSLL